MLPFYMLKGIPDLEFTLMEKNMSLNLSLVKRSPSDPGAPRAPKCHIVISRGKLQSLKLE